MPKGIMRVLIVLILIVPILHNLMMIWYVACDPGRQQFIVKMFWDKPMWVSEKHKVRIYFLDLNAPFNFALTIEINISEPFGF